MSALFDPANRRPSESKPPVQRPGRTTSTQSPPWPLLRLLSRYRTSPLIRHRSSRTIRPIGCRTMLHSLMAARRPTGRSRRTRRPGRCFGYSSATEARRPYRRSCGRSVGRESTDRRLVHDHLRDLDARAALIAASATLPPPNLAAHHSPIMSAIIRTDSSGGRAQARIKSRRRRAFPTSSGNPMICPPPKASA